MLEGDGKPKSINLNRILFLFLFSFVFPLNFLKISLGMSLVLQWHVLYLENLFLFFSSFTLNFSSLFFFNFSFLSKKSSTQSFLQ